MIHIDKITIATRNHEEMKNFYANSFHIHFAELDCGTFTMYQGDLNGIEILLCPCSIAGIDAKENNLQLRFVVQRIEETVQECLNNGGKVIQEISEDSGRFTSGMQDPDGNCMEITQLKTTQ